MKYRTKNPSKNLGDSMRRGGTTPTQQTSNIQKGKDGTTSADNNAVDSQKTRIGEELDQLDTAIFESILQDAAAAKPELVKNVASSGIDPAIMGLIDGAKQRHTAEKDPSNVTNPKAPVEDIVVGKPPTLTPDVLSRSPNIKSPVRGNPVTDFDKMNSLNGINGENSLVMNPDPFSRLEMGHHNVDSLDETKVKESQRNVKCDEKEQLDYMKERGLNDYAKFDTILGPASNGEFASFAQNLTPVIASELGVLNPVNTNSYNIFQTCTTNGRLLPAIPRKYFCTTENHPRPTHRPTPQKPPVTIMLQSTAPSLHTTTTLTDSQIPSIYSQTLTSLSPPAVVEAQGTPLVESASMKKRAKKAAKKAASKTTSDEKNSVDSDGKEDKEDVEDEEEKENNLEDGLTEKEREARRKKNIKNKEKKKAKRLEEKKELEIKPVDVPETPLNSGRGTQNDAQKTSSLGVGSGSPDESPKNQQNNGRRANMVGGGGKNKKNEKSVSSEYTVGSNGVGSHSLEDILKDLGLDVSEIADKPKKNKKGNNNTSKKATKQQKKDQAVKETARSPTSDNELSLDDEAEKNKKQQGKKKMDEVAVAASITKRCSSGVGQSEEDDDQSYVSAQENLGGSTSRLSTPPLQAEFMDARQSRDEIIENVMLDPNNYRDDEDVESLAKQLQQQEDEFITVGKNKKKNKKQASIQENIASSTASSSSPPNRRNSTTGQASNVSPSGNNQPQQHQHQRSNNRPVAHSTTLGDFMESTKKDTHKNIKHKKVASPISSSAQKKQALLEEPTPSSPAFVDALETPISVNTAHTFSYADAAKKSSGENTPAHEMSPVPQLATNAASTSAKNLASPSVPPSEAANESTKIQDTQSSYAPPKFISTTKSSAVQLPASSVAAVDSDFSFGYEETLDDKRKREQKEAETRTSQTSHNSVGVSAATFLKTFAKQNEQKLKDMPSNSASESNVLATEIVCLWQTRWNTFSAGSKPRVYKPLQK